MIPQNHIELKIVRGVYRAPGDPNSAEQPIYELNLLESNGLALDVDGWSPSIAALKSGGVWADSAAADGRQLVSSAVGNVTEQLRLTMGNSDLLQRYAMLTQLHRLAQEARNFFATDWQVEPVYLTWHAACAQVPQHALIYNIEVAQASDIFDTLSPWDITLTIEREPAWRILVPPGGNPIEWHFWTQGKTPGVDYTYLDMGLISGTDHFAYQLVNNRYEINPSDALAPLSQNYVDIDAGNVPGDAPALALLTLDYHDDSANVYDQFVGLSTNPRTLYDRLNAVDDAQYLVFNAGDASIGAGSKATDTCGVISNGSASSKYIVTYTVGASGGITLLTWTPEINLTRGYYIAFLRCKQTNGNLGDVRARARVQIPSAGGNAASITNAYQIIPTLAAASLCVNRFGLLYLGTIGIPHQQGVNILVDGEGLASSTPVALAIDILNTVGATRDLEFLDLVLIPISQGSAQIAVDNPSGTYGVVLDNTGYLSRCKTGDAPVGGMCQVNSAPAILPLYPREVRGPGFSLVPGRDNRLYFINNSDTSTPTYYSRAYDQDAVVRVNIVPRCYGIADVSRSV